MALFSSRMIKYISLFRIIILTLLFTLLYIMVRYEGVNGLAGDFFLGFTNFLNYCVLILITADIKVGSVVKRRHFLAFPVTDMDIFLIRLKSMILSPWWFGPFAVPLILLVDTSNQFTEKLNLVALVYLSLILTASITFWVWDYLTLRKWQEHIFILYVLPLMLLVWLPKYGLEIWLLANPFGGWVLAPYHLSEIQGMPYSLATAASLLICWMTLLLLVRWSRNWYFIDNE